MHGPSEPAEFTGNYFCRVDHRGLKFGPRSSEGSPFHRLCKMSRSEAQTDGLNVPQVNGHAHKGTEGDMTLTILGCGKLQQNQKSKAVLAYLRLQARWVSPFSPAFSLPSHPSRALNHPHLHPAPLPLSFSKKKIILHLGCPPASLPA